MWKVARIGCCAETRDHLFFDCPFAKSCWDLLKINWDLTFGMSQRILRASENFAGPCFMEIISCAAWNIWKERNEIIFKGATPSFTRWKVRFQTDILVHQYRIKPAFV
jgi:hypothetical protein